MDGVAVRCPIRDSQPDPYGDYSAALVRHPPRAARRLASPRAARLVHNRWRNFYLPGRNDVFAGFRTCAVEAPEGL